jgi:hypothetical protein
MPKDKGVTSRRTMSELIPSRAAPPPVPPDFKIAPWTAAPIRINDDVYLNKLQTRMLKNE